MSSIVPTPSQRAFVGKRNYQLSRIYVISCPHLLTSFHSFKEGKVYLLFVKVKITSRMIIYFQISPIWIGRCIFANVN
uniref:Ovule protein n=1 Tax=Heterorhabditis bacteriophora TaxID=37862 RepID=A0A1I7WWA1_HETBA